MKKRFLLILAAPAIFATSFLARANADEPSEAALTSDAFARVVAPGAKVEILATGFGFTEGPTWNPRGFWIFSDISGNALHRISPSGKVALVRKPSSHTNGNTYDAQNRLVSCEQSPARRVARKELSGNFETLAEKYEGKRLNSPNDLAIRGDGSIYFTDPTYGTDKSELELDFRGLYRIFPDGKLELLDRSWNQPNGICFSPDQNTLYVGDSQEGKIFRFDVDKNGQLSGKTLLATIPKPGDPDGMKCDAAGHLYVTGPGGVWIFAPRGGLLGKIPTPQNPANIGFGGADGKTLLITAQDSIYSVKLKQSEGKIY
ncbi:SMP-30/gluconolactonase/LRE family protein [Abditibacterium utsteinense]|nr:SMP-30/gluconolactonase/LRE family protein [Abditibacterium utsteinense]